MRGPGLSDEAAVSACMLCYNDAETIAGLVERAAGALDEIGLEGEVGAIGGLAQKVSAVRQAGVPYFIVPTAQGDDALARAREIAGGEVEIIPVATLDEALAALERIGGDPL